MGSAAPAAAAIPGEGADHKKRKGQQRNVQENMDLEQIKDTLTLCVKLCLNVKQETRKLMGVCMVSFMTPKEAIFNMKAKEAVDRFQKTAKEFDGSVEDRVIKVGIPSTWIFNAWISHAQEAYKTMEKSDRVQQALAMVEEYIATTNGMTEKERMLLLAQEIPHIMVSTPFDKKLKRTELCLRGSAEQVFSNAVYPLIKQQKGYRVLLGQAPKSALERQLQDFLDTLDEEQ